MANYFTLQDGNLTDSSVYGISLSSAEVLNNISISAAWLDTVDSYGPIFIGNGNNINGIAVNLSATGQNSENSTLILKLSSSSGIVSETYPLSSFVNYNTNRTLSYLGKWQLLKLTNPYSLLNLSPARISLATSSPNTLALMCGTTNNNNYNKFVITSNATVPTMVDDIHIGGSLKGTQIESRVINANTSSFSNIYIHNKGTLNFPLTSNVNINVNGIIGIQINSGGTLNIGTNSSPVPLSTTHTIILSNNTIDINDGGTFNVYGYPRLQSTYLSSDTISGSRTFSVTDNVSTSWLSGDTLVFTPNLTSNKTNYDVLVLSSFTGSRTFTTRISSVYNHLGLSSLPNVPSVFNLTRNVVIRGFDNAISLGSIRTIDSGKLNLNYALLSNFGASYGSSTVALKNNLEILNNSAGTTTLCGTVLSNFNNSINGGYSTRAGFVFSAYPTNFNYLCASNVNFNVGLTGDFTFETWFYLLQPSTLARIMYASGNNFNIDFYNSNTITLFDGTQGYTLASSTDYSIGTWNHLAVVRRSQKWHSYMNGKFIVSGTTTGNPSVTGTNYLSIGSLPYNASTNIPGYLSNLRISNSAIYTSNFTPLVNLEVLPSTRLLILTDKYGKRDISPTNALIQEFGFINQIITPVKDNTPLQNLNLYNSILTNNLSVINTSANNLNINNNIILNASNTTTGLILTSVSGNIAMNNNIVVGSQNYGVYLQNNSVSGTYGALSYNAANQGMMVSGSNTGTIVGGSINSSKEGVYVNCLSSGSSSVSFENIISNNNTNGFRLSGNNLNYLTPTILNINNLSSNNNSQFGLEASNITGNLTGLILNNNLSGGMRVSIGSGPTTFNGLTSILSGIPVNILSGYNYSPFVFSNTLLSSNSSVGMVLDSTRFNRFSLENSTISASIGIQLNTTRNLIEGSYLINNSFLGSSPLGTGIVSKYQPYASKSTGFAFMNFNKIPSINVTYFSHGERSLDNSIAKSSSEYPSERLTPYSKVFKLKSGSKFVALNSGDNTTIRVYVRTSTSNETLYNGSNPRLILKANPSMGIFSDIVLDVLQADSMGGGMFVLLSGTTPIVTNNGVLEFYVDCDGTQGWINIDNWEAN